MQNNTQSDQLTNFDTFNIICQFLNLKDKIVFAYTSKLLSFFLQQHFAILLSQGIYDKTSDKTPSQLMKYNFNRNLRVVSIPSIIEGKKQNFTYFNFFKHKCITKIEAGGKHFIAFVDNKNQAYLTKPIEFIPVKYKPIKYQIFKDVKRVFCNSERLFIHYIDGSVGMATPSQEQEKIYDNLQLIDWTLRLPVLDMTVSKNYAVFILGQIRYSEIRKLILLEEVIEHQKSQSKQETIKVLVYSIQACKFYIINYTYKQIKSYCVGSNTVYFVNQNRQLLHCVLTNLNEGQTELTPSIFSLMEERQVVSIHCGLHYYIAVTREQNLLINWNNQHVIQWLRKQGLQDYINIFRVQKIDGKKLVSLEKRYMEDVLGITNINLQKKLLLSIQQHQKVSYKKDEIYGWGKNQCGQLATNMAFFVNKPVKIKIPELNKNQNITEIICGWFNTILRTNENRIFITKPNTKKQNEKNSQFEQEKKSERKRKKTQNQQDMSPKTTKKKNISKQQRQIQKGTQKYQQQPSWVQYKPPNTCFNVNTVKDILLIVQLAHQQQQNKKKLRPVKAILDKIQWDPNLKKQEFKIGYFDKYMGILQMSIEQYLHSQVKQHRISYFKRNQQIVWHRQNRIDIV